MNNRALAERLPDWFTPQGSYPETVVYSGVEVARSLAGKKFWTEAGFGKTGQRNAVIKAAKALFGPGEILRARNMSATTKGVLSEKYPWLAKAAKHSSGALFVLEDGFWASVGPTEALRLYSYAGGVLPDSCLWRAMDAAFSLGQVLEFAYDPSFGFLNPRLDEVGPGLRFHALVHLPGAIHTEELGFLRENLEQMGVDCKGFQRGWPKPHGNLVVISHCPGVGKGAEEALSEFRDILGLVVKMEKKAREVLLSSVWEIMEDRAVRSLAVLRVARVISWRELLDRLSWVRLGVSMGMLEPIPMREVNQLLFLTGPKHMAAIKNEDPTDLEEDIMRASFVRAVASGWD